MPFLRSKRDADRSLLGIDGAQCNALRESGTGLRYYAANVFSNLDASLRQRFDGCFGRARLPDRIKCVHDVAASLFSRTKSGLPSTRDVLAQVNGTLSECAWCVLDEFFGQSSRRDRRIYFVWRASFNGFRIGAYAIKRAENIARLRSLWCIVGGIRDRRPARLRALANLR